MKERLVWSPISPGAGEVTDGAASSRWYRDCKPALDRLVAVIAIILLLPFLIAIAIAIRLDSPGPVLYRQRRLGKNRTPFTMYKFRTMRSDADDAPHRLAFERFFHARSLNETGASSFKLQNDSRVTRVGRILRSTSLDELPQLVNVLNGTMSLVGPRPPIPYETSLYESSHWQRLAVRPGITGVWQVSARNRVPFEEMIAIDLNYIAHESFWLDLKILVLTVGAVINRKGAG